MAYLARYLQPRSALTVTKHLALLVVPFLCFAEKAATQENLLDRFVGSYEVLRSTLPAPDAEIIIRAVSAAPLLVVRS